MIFRHCRFVFCFSTNFQHAVPWGVPKRTICKVEKASVPRVPKMLVKIVQSNSLIHKITYVRCFECWLPPMKFKQAFFSCLFRFFQLFFSTQDECRDIFDEFFGPKNFEKFEKFVENVETFVLC